MRASQIVRLALAGPTLTARYGICQSLRREADAIALRDQNPHTRKSIWAAERRASRRLSEMFYQPTRSGYYWPRGDWSGERQVAMEFLALSLEDEGD